MANELLYKVPDQTDKVVLITGANSGIGLRATIRLAQAGARVAMACRNPQKAATAAEHVRSEAPGADVSVLQLDLSSQASVRNAAATIRDELPHLDMLINNAGVMAIPHALTEDGWETQLATNHFGHFALTGLLMDLLVTSGSARIVTVSSEAHRVGRMKFDDLDGERRYNSWLAYGQSKIANLYFAFELQRRCEKAGLPVQSMAVHPGYSATNLQASGRGINSGPKKAVMDLGNSLFGQSDSMGALPTLHAATSPTVIGGGFYGPGGMGGMRGFPVPVSCAKRARDVAIGSRLWDVSVDRTGVEYGPLAR